MFKWEREDSVAKQKWGWEWKALRIVDEASAPPGRPFSQSSLHLCGLMVDVTPRNTLLAFVALIACNLIFGLYVTVVASDLSPRESAATSTDSRIGLFSRFFLLTFALLPSLVLPSSIRSASKACRPSSCRSIANWELLQFSSLSLPA